MSDDQGQSGLQLSSSMHLPLTNTSRHRTKSCLSDHSISFTKENRSKGYLSLETNHYSSSRKKSGTGYDLASFWPVNLFVHASPKGGKHKQESFNATRWCLFTKTYIQRTNIQRSNKLKVEYAVEMKFLAGKWIQGVKIQVNLLTFTAWRFHVLDHSRP